MRFSKLQKWQAAVSIVAIFGLVALIVAWEGSIIDLAVDADSAADGTVYIDRDASDNMVFVDPNAGSNTLSSLKAGGSPTKIIDADADTKVDTEESSDEDFVRIDAGGTEVLTIGDGAGGLGVGIGDTTPTEGELVIDDGGGAAGTPQINFNGARGVVKYDGPNNLFGL